MCVDLFRKLSFKAACGLKSSLLEGTCLIKLNLHLGKRTGKSPMRKADTIWTNEGEIQVTESLSNQYRLEETCVLWRFQTLSSPIPERSPGLSKIWTCGDGATPTPAFLKAHILVLGGL